MPDFVIKAGDTLPILADTLTYSDGSSVNLTGATVQFLMRSSSAATTQVNAAATIVNPTSPASVQYAFQTADTAGVAYGQFLGSWAVTYAGGATMTFPTDGYLDIWVEPNLLNPSQYLVGLPDVKDHLNIPATDRTHDQKLLRWILAARPVIEAVTTTAMPRIFDEWYDGGTYFIHLRHRPATLLIACDMYMGPTDYPETQVQDPAHGSIYSVMLDTSGDRIVRRAPGGGVMAFPKMPNSVHVVYQAGPSTVPENIRIGCLEMIREHWVPTQQPGWGRQGPQAGVDDEAPQHEPVDFLLSPRVREWLTPSRRHPSVF